MSDLFDVLGVVTPDPKGFYWSSNNPYLRPLWVRVRRQPKGAAVGLPYPMVGEDANPAGIIYESMTDSIWGMGCPDDLMDFQSFSAAANVLGLEGFGMSLAWMDQSSLDDFTNIILEHIDGQLYVAPTTGLHTLTLIRDDYDPETLPALTPDDAKMMSFQRRGWGETINEMVVTWTNPANEKEETVTLQDLGNVAKQGAVVSSNKNYFGVRNRDLAMRLCARELRKAAAPTATCEMRVFRRDAAFVPGGVVKVTWPEYSMNGVVMRISEVDYGTPSEPFITLKMAEDVFSLSRAQYTVPPESSWQDSSEEPTAADATLVVALPAFVAARAAGAAVSELAYPEVVTGILASTENEDNSGYVLNKEAVTANGSTEWEEEGTRVFLGRSQLPVSLPAEAQSTIASLPPVTTGSLPTASGLILFDTGSEAGQELALVSSVDENGYHLKRGVLDTVPRALPVGTPMWFLNPGVRLADPELNAAGETTEYKLLTKTSLGVLDLDNAPITSGVMTDRPHLPSRPANVQVEGQGFAPVDVSNLTQVSVTWARRNRVTEEQVVLPWTDGDVSPEAGQTTTVRSLDTGGTLLAEHTGLTGTSFTLPLSDFGERELGLVEVVSVRDGMESLQGFRIFLKLVPDNVRITESGDYRVAEDGTYRTSEGYLYDLPLTNGNAEAGGATGWTTVAGVLGTKSSPPAAYAGTYYFYGPASSEMLSGQDVAIPVAAEAGVDAGDLAALVRWRQTSAANTDTGEIVLEFLDDLGASLGSSAAGLQVSSSGSWELREHQAAVPAGTRTVKVSIHGVRQSGNHVDAYFDAIEAGLVPA